jgi:hypothetical protein
MKYVGVYRAGQDKAGNKKGEERGEESNRVAETVTVKVKKSLPLSPI